MAFQAPILPYGQLPREDAILNLDFIPWIPDRIVHPLISLIEAKKRYVYMVQSGIMNYNW